MNTSPNDDQVVVNIIDINGDVVEIFRCPSVDDAVNEFEDMRSHQEFFPIDHEFIIFKDGTEIQRLTINAEPMT